MIISFRQATIQDCKMMRDWIKNNEFVKKWYYHNKVPRLSTLEKKMERKLNTKNMKVNIVLCDDFPIGYIQSYPVDGNGSWTTKVRVAENMVSLDYYIGDINFIHKGIGKLMLLEYIKIVSKEGYNNVLISPDPENFVQEKLMKKLGFTYIKTVNVPYINSPEREAIYVKQI